MDVLEKLVELLDDIQVRGEDFTDCEIYGMRVPGTVSNENVASHLIAHGVTVQEWISVKDRLPEYDEIVTICTEKGFVYAGELIGDTWFLDNDSWTANVTHWMPMPQPPKGE